MTGEWWRVKPPTQNSFLVLVVAGRIAAISHPHVLIDIGDPWPEMRQTLERRHSYEFSEES